MVGPTGENMDCDILNFSLFSLYKKSTFEKSEISRIINNNTEIKKKIKLL